MTIEMTGARRRTPWHLWVLGGLNALWTAFGCYDYVMTNTQGDAYLPAMDMSEASIALYHAMPAWMTGAWALGVWGGLAGSLLLLARSRWAVWALIVSAIGAVGSSLPNLLDARARAAMEGQAWMGVVIMLVAAAIAAYAVAMRKRGVLR